ncbi:sigma E protease regulator RseP [Psychrosphaera ytuae]|uniref:Zinc metalloprotease n=1 Tax=Psychrosphaera ytuae TaxID=2820710 RepID=A0A975DDC4_9GAMM|nr:sigma E protease regulator RseP [Psychrosphaera ytuae]QTH64793.1 sigma E protease regulator RseP [Psychrosphaera ytuae]
MDVLTSIVGFIVALGILVFVHEYGHFWVAKRNGVKVIRFAVGFGKPIYSWHGKDGTEYVIGMIPLGGYVRMLDGRVDQVLESEQHLAFDKKSVWQRIAIVAAGPMANFVFAILLVFVVLLHGTPALKPVVGNITANSIAQKGGLQLRDEILQINEQKVISWQEVTYALAAAVGDEQLHLVVEREGRTHNIFIDSKGWQLEDGDLLSGLGIEPFRPNATLNVAFVDESAPAGKAGVQAGDKIVTINGKLITEWQDAVDIFTNSANQTLSLEVQRGNEIIGFELKPDNRPTEDGFSRGYVGIAPQSEPWPKGYVFTNQYDILPAVFGSFVKTWELIELTFSMIGKFITGSIGLDNLSGPIAIAQGAGVSAQSGFVYFISFMALISVNLGVINLLPLPVLDGGHLMYFIIELIRGKPVSERVQEMGFRFGAMALMMIMGIALFNDFARL